MTSTITFVVVKTAYGNTLLPEAEHDELAAMAAASRMTPAELLESWLRDERRARPRIVRRRSEGSVRHGC